MWFNLIPCASLLFHSQGRILSILMLYYTNPTYYFFWTLPSTHCFHECLLAQNYSKKPSALVLLRLLCVHESPEDLVKESDAGGLECSLRFYISNKLLGDTSMLVLSPHWGGRLWTVLFGRQKFYYQLHQLLTDDSGQVINPLNLSYHIQKWHLAHRVVRILNEMMNSKLPAQYPAHY